MIACKVCGEVHDDDPLPEGTVGHCSRCGSVITRRTAGSLHLTAAFALSALLLYWPANIFPILRLDMYGATQENTVWQGVVRFWQGGDYFISIIVFLASIFIPLLKLLGLFFLVFTSLVHLEKWKMPRTWVFRVIESVGRWAMLDVFVLAILVSLMRLRELATVIAGKGALAFACVVVLTLLASASFDPQLIWKGEEPHRAKRS